MSYATERDPIKFAYWAPNVSGGLVVSSIEQRTSWTLDYNVKLAQIDEKEGFDYALSQIRFTAGYGAEFQHEPVSFSQALLAATEKLKVIAAILPGPWNPATVSKQIATINHISNGRVAVNIVSGWFRGEFHAIGEPWLDHDERYRRSEEFIRALRGIWTQDSFTFAGDFYRFREFSLKAKPVEPLPDIFQGGSSRAARDTASRVSDWYSTNGNTPVIERAVLRPLANRPPITLFMATLGLAYVVEGGAQLMGGAQVHALDLGVSDTPFDVYGVFVSKFDLFAAAVAGVMVALPIAFFQYSRVGVAFRAAAADSFAAGAIGLRLPRILASAWIAAGFTALVAGLL